MAHGSQREEGGRGPSHSHHHKTRNWTARWGTGLEDAGRPRSEAPIYSRNSNIKCATRPCALVGVTQAGLYLRPHGALGECGGRGLRAQEAKECGPCSRRTTTRLESYGLPRSEEHT